VIVLKPAFAVFAVGFVNAVAFTGVTPQDRD